MGRQGRATILIPPWLTDPRAGLGVVRRLAQKPLGVDPLRQPRLRGPAEEPSLERAGRGWEESGPAWALSSPLKVWRRVPGVPSAAGPGLALPLQGKRLPPDALASPTDGTSSVHLPHLPCTRGEVWRCSPGAGALCKAGRRSRSLGTALRKGWSYEGKGTWGEGARGPKQPSSPTGPGAARGLGGPLGECLLGVSVAKMVRRWAGPRSLWGSAGGQGAWLVSGAEEEGISSGSR